MRAKLISVLLLLALAMAGLVPTAAAQSSPGGDDDADDSVDAEAIFPIDGHQVTPADNVVLQWNEEALQCVRVLRERPMVVARALFILHTAMYDAWAAYDARAVPTQRPSGWQRQPTSQRTVPNRERALSRAAHLALTDVFPGCRAEFDQQLAALGFSTADTSAPAEIGRQAAQRVVDARRNDGANQAGGYADTSGYRPATNGDPWRWQPLPGQVPMTPHWGNVRPFNPNMRNEIQVPTPRRDSGQTIDDILRESANLNDTTRMIAEYWADGPNTETPAGHWNLFSQYLSKRYRHSLDQDVRLFFALNAAMLDASIAVWSVKYRYDFARPATAIPALRPGSGFRSYIPTPPFPEYPSGHSAFSAAAAAVLKDVRNYYGGGDQLTASVTFQPGDSFVQPGVFPRQRVTLSWRTFYDAADQAGVSRRYGGIHWIEGDMASRDLGKKLGEQAYALARRYWEGG